ncbi:restriction endonuclease [Anaerolineae bacterium CFX9]|nr:restriction endonuclease [Anaerolineae bacterium CFX9]
MIDYFIVMHPIALVFCTNTRRTYLRDSMTNKTYTNLTQYEREQLRALKAKARDEEKALKDAEKQRRLQDKQAKADHEAAQLAKVEMLNRSLDELVLALGNVLKESLTKQPVSFFQALRKAYSPKPFRAVDLSAGLTKPVYHPPKTPSALKLLIPGAKDAHKRNVERAQRTFRSEMNAFESRYVELKKQWEQARANHAEQEARTKEDIETYNSALDRFQQDYESGAPKAIVAYFAQTLELSDYSIYFAKQEKLAYVPESKQLVIDFELPKIEVVPNESSYKYVRTKDEISSVKRPATQIKSLYSSLIAQIALRTLHEVFTADYSNHVESVVFNGHVDTIDKGTGTSIRPCLVTVRATKETFRTFDLNRVDPIECLKVLHASVSKSPDELLPVKPVLEFNMVDPRFVDEVDVLSTIDQRPNLMDLTPGGFENLITNLFSRMGLETRLTRASRDGGVDCVAFDQRPILGGKVVIQAKRYKNTVGVSAVRDLFGTLHNEGASKGILVTTSGFGQAAFEFANGKPLELIDGSRLLYLLKEHAGIDAKIVIPTDWVEPKSDTPE